MYISDVLLSAEFLFFNNVMECNVNVIFELSLFTKNNIFLKSGAVIITSSSVLFGLFMFVLV